MKTIRVRGTPYEIGLQFGRTLKEWHRQFKPSERTLEFARGCEGAAKKHAPEILEELRGVAESSGTAYDSLISTNLAPGAMFQGGCTVIAIDGRHTVSRRPIFARHMDWMKKDVEALHVIYSEPEDGFQSTGFSFGDIGRYGGQNEAGLTVGTAYVGMYADSPQPGIRLNISSRWILDNCAKTEEAVKYLEGIPHTEPVNFLLIDAAGTIARVETCPKKVSTKYAEDGMDIATVFYTLDEMKPLDRKWPDDLIFYKYEERVRSWFRDHRGDITVDLVKKLCSSPEKGICEYYGAPGDDDEITIWSWIAEANPSQVEISPGPPCNTAYQKL
jgi:predicted choloylglycine hydrolase